MRYGAPEEAWRHFAGRLDLTEHLLPVVSNPNAAIAERSTMKSLGKTPSVYDRNREVVGLGKWTAFHASPADVDRWSREPDYGMCIQARAVRAIDIDVPDPDQADAIEQMIVTVLDGIVLPARRRANSGKRLLAFRYEPEMTKRVVPVDGGIVEFLGDGQQFIAAGTHDSGFPYAWDCATGLPASIPVLTDAELHAVWSTLVALFATGEPTIARAKREGSGAVFDGALTDSFGQWLVEHWEVYDTGPDGELYLRCPFEDDHTSDSGVTSTAYFMAGTGGYERGHMKCLHAHCAARSDHDFQAKTGYIGSGFTALPERVSPVMMPSADDFLPREGASADPLLLEATEDLVLPNVSRDKSGAIIVNADNMNKLLSTPSFTGMMLGYDSFRGAMMWAPAQQDPPQWREFTDNDYVNLEIALVRRQVDPPGHDTLRRWVRKAAADRTFDSAAEWLGRLAWDGVPRIDRFLHDYLGVVHDNRGYDVAVSRYIWTALAGRVIQPGVQADMVPILYGDQGARKTSAIRALVPAADFYATIDMGQRDEDTARLMRGTLVNELEELRGLRSRDAEAIKAWITKSADKWTPKYVEFSATYLRRSVFFGTTNKDDFLDDPTGERRWLPFTVGRSGKIDIEALVRDREQLWAEGAALFRIDGIQWQAAEELAPTEQQWFKADDSYAEPIMDWLLAKGLDGAAAIDRMQRKDGDGVSNRELAIGIGMLNRATDRSTLTSIGIAMKKLGFVQRQVGVSRTRRWFSAT